MNKLTLNELTEWLDQEQKEEDVIIFDNGVVVIPYATVERDLDVLSNSMDGVWSTKNFNRVFTILNGNETVDANIEIVVPTPTGVRTLVGCATYSLKFIRESLGAAEKQLSGDINEHYTATAKSFAIVNACKNLGRRFGKYLNSALPIKEYFEEINDLPIISKDQEDNIHNEEGDIYEAVKTSIKYCGNEKAALSLIDKANLSETIKEKLKADIKKITTLA